MMVLKLKEEELKHGFRQRMNIAVFTNPHLAVNHAVPNKDVELQMTIIGHLYMPKVYFECMLTLQLSPLLLHYNSSAIFCLCV